MGKFGAPRRTENLRQSQNWAEGVTHQIRKMNEELVKQLQTTLLTEPDKILAPILQDHLASVRNALQNAGIKGGVLGLPEKSVENKNTLRDIGTYFDALRSGFEACQTKKGKKRKSVEMEGPQPLKRKSDASEGRKEEVTPSPFKGFAFGAIGNGAKSTFDFGTSSNGDKGNTSLPSAGFFSRPFKPAPSATVTGAFFEAPPEEPPATSGLANFQFNLANGASSTPAAQTQSKEGDEEEEEESQEKYEVKTVEETNSLYSIRCKLFRKIGGNYTDKGVGILHVKALEGGKHQMLLRADNNLGTIMLNVPLQKGLPLQRKSPKDIMTMDPVGDKGEPMAILLRVKSAEDSNVLLSNLEKYCQD